LIAKVKGAAAANVFAPASQFVKTALLDEDLDNDGTTHEASFMARTSCKNFVMNG